MAKQLFTNNAASTLAAGISNGATSLSVAAGEGAKFPALSAGDWFLATLFVLAGVTESNHEIVKVTARATDTFTIVRAQDGTSGQAFSTGDRIELRWTAAVAQQAADSLPKAGGSLSGSLGINNASPTCALSVAGVGQFTGNTFPTAGAGVEISYNSGIAGVSAYDRGGAAYLPLTCNASYHTWQISGTEKMRLETSGRLNIGASTTPVRQLQVNHANGSGGTGAARVAQSAIQLVNNTADGNSTNPNYTGITASYDPATPRQGILFGTYGNDFIDFHVGADFLNPLLRLGANNQVTVWGTAVGQTAANISTTGSMGGMLEVRDKGASAGNGGGVLFTAGDGAWKFASIKGYVQDGTGNSAGSLVLSTRRITSDTTLTPLLWLSNACVGVGAQPSGSYTIEVAGNGWIDGALRARSFHPKVRTLSANTTLTGEDGEIIANTGGGGFTLTLPSAATAGAGYSCNIRAFKSYDANTVTFAVPTGQSMNGTTNGTYAVSTSGAVVSLISDGVSGWWAKAA